MDPNYRRRLDYSPGKLIIPPHLEAERLERERAKQETLVSYTCPRCKYQGYARREFCSAICVADEAPYVGDNRGCGWMLGVEPPFAGGRTARAFAVIDLKVDRQTGKMPKTLFVEGHRRILQEWERRGLVKARTDSEGKVVGYDTPAASALPSEN